MGVRVLEGTYDGTEPAAVMVDSVTGFAFGPIFQGDDAADQVEAFVAWLATGAHMDLVPEIGLDEKTIPDPRRDSFDARTWPDSGLELVFVYWKRNVRRKETG